MNFKIFMDEKANTEAANRLLKFIVLVIGGTVLVNSVMIYTVTRHERTILVPAGLNSRVEITDGQASDSYIELMTRYSVGLALNYTPATAREQFGELLNLYSPDAFPEARKAFYSIADTVETAGVTSSFYISRIKVDRVKGLIEVTGLARQFGQDGNALGGEKQTEYELSYRISDGRFMLTGFADRSAEKGGDK